MSEISIIRINDLKRTRSRLSLLTQPLHRPWWIVLLSHFLQEYLGGAPTVSVVSAYAIVIRHGRAVSERIAVVEGRDSIVLNIISLF